MTSEHDVPEDVKEMARRELEGWEKHQSGGRTDPNTIPDEVADAAQIEHFEFIVGWDETPLTKRELGITRQAWKCAIAVALDRMQDLK